MEGEADHILAARFLRRFVKDLPWVHMDLSASTCKGGLGASASDVTGFGVAWGLEMLARIRRAEAWRECVARPAIDRAQPRPRFLSQTKRTKRCQRFSFAASAFRALA